MHNFNAICRITTYHRVLRVIRKWHNNLIVPRFEDGIKISLQYLQIKNKFHIFAENFLNYAID